MGYNSAAVITPHLKAGPFTAWHLILQQRHLCSSMHNDEAPPVLPNSQSARAPERSTPWKDRLQMRQTFHSQQPLVLPCFFSVFSPFLPHIVFFFLCKPANHRFRVDPESSALLEKSARSLLLLWPLVNVQPVANDLVIITYSSALICSKVFTCIMHVSTCHVLSTDFTYGSPRMNIHERRKEKHNQLTVNIILITSEEPYSVFLFPCVIGIPV